MKITSPDEARAFAAEAHKNQKYGDGPYTDHLDEVVAVLQEVGWDDPAFKMAGYLHDILEDTPVTSQDLWDTRCPAPVVCAVMFCTDEPGPNRKTRKAATYERVRQDLARNLPCYDMAAIVKWADRIANMRACTREGKTSLLEMYRKESPAFMEVYIPQHEPLLTYPRWQALVQAYKEALA